MTTKFQYGVALPAENEIGYGQVFCLEQWMRRLARLALSAVGGTNPNSALDAEMLAALKARRATVSQTAYLGISIPQDLLGLTTLEELTAILTSDNIYPAVRRISGFDRALITRKLDEVREIRNAIGHNRLISRKTCLILDAAVLSLEDGIDRLRATIAAGPEHRQDYGSPADEGRVSQLAVALTKHPLGSLSDERILLRSDKDFYYLGVTPRHLAEHVSQTLEQDLPSVEGDEIGALGEWLDLALLLAALNPVIAILSAIVVPARGTSFETVWARKASEEEHGAVVETVVQAAERVWSDVELSSQNESLFASEKLWLSGDPSDLVCADVRG